MLNWSLKCIFLLNPKNPKMRGVRAVMRNSDLPSQVEIIEQTRRLCHLQADPTKALKTSTIESIALLAFNFAKIV